MKAGLVRFQHSCRLQGIAEATYGDVDAYSNKRASKHTANKELLQRRHVLISYAPSPRITSKK